MDRNSAICLKAQSHLSAVNIEHRDFEHTLEADGPSDDNRFLAFPRQDQHGSTSIVMLDRLAHWCLAAVPRRRKRKKTDVVEHPGVFDHVGLLVNGPLGMAGLPFI
jgi:hypothetical protein